MKEGPRFRRMYRLAGQAADKVVVISEDDKRDFAQFVDSKKIAVVPHGVDIDRLSAEQPVPEFDVITYGYTSLVHNGEFLAEVINEAARRTDYPLRWALAGPYLPPALRGLPGVVELGFVEDIRWCVSRSRVVALPTLVASGVKTTVLEAWALGRPVVATPSALRGLKCHPGIEALVGETAPELASLILGALDDAQLRITLGQAGRALVELNFDIQKNLAPFSGTLIRSLASAYRHKPAR